MSLKYIKFDFDEQNGWTIQAEGGYPKDIYALLKRIPRIAEAFFPHLASEQARPSGSRPDHSKDGHQVVETGADPAGVLLCAITPDGQIYRLEDVKKDPRARGTGWSIFWVDPDTGDLSRCKGKEYVGWPEQPRPYAEERFRAWAAEKGYEIKEVRGNAS